MNIVFFVLLLTPALSQLQLALHGNPSNSAGNFTMDNQKEFQYYAFLALGTPPQNCSLIFDICTSHFWISTIWGDYSSNKSSTYSPTTQTSNISYAPGSVSGVIGTEMLAVPQLNITNLTQSMLFVTKADKISNLTDGLLGLNSDTSAFNWLDLALKAGQLKDAQFAFDLRTTSNASYFYAGSASFPKENLTWITSNMANYWSIAISSTTIDNSTQPQDYNAQTAILDTRTSYLTMGEIGYNMLQNDEAISTCQYNQQFDMFICPCNGTYPTITFSSGSLDLVVVASNYMVTLQGGYCALGVQANMGYSVMIFGDSVMRNYLVAFDKTNQKVGFSAPESKNSTGFEQR